MRVRRLIVVAANTAAIIHAEWPLYQTRKAVFVGVAELLVAGSLETLKRSVSAEVDHLQQLALR